VQQQIIAQMVVSSMQGDFSQENIILVLQQRHKHQLGTGDRMPMLKLYVQVEVYLLLDKNHALLQQV